MKTIRKKQSICASLAGLSILLGILLLIFQGVWSDIYDRMLLPIVMIIGLILIILLAYESAKYRTARLITENPIMHYNTALISDISDQEPKRPNIEYDEIIVSYFGILLNDKTIMFNQKGIRLKAVVIGKAFISLTYGTKTRTRNIRLLCPLIGPDAIGEISKKFIYETGITPAYTPLGIEDI